MLKKLEKKAQLEASRIAKREKGMRHPILLEIQNILIAFLAFVLFTVKISLRWF